MCLTNLTSGRYTIEQRLKIERIFKNKRSNQNTFRAVRDFVNVFRIEKTVRKISAIRFYKGNLTTFSRPSVLHELQGFDRQ